MKLRYWLVIVLLIGVVEVKTATAGELKKWTFEGESAEVFHVAARVIQQNWVLRLADPKLYSLRFETAPTQNNAAGGPHRSVCDSRAVYVASLREIRPGFIEISLRTMKGSFFPPPVDDCISERLFLSVQTELYPTIVPPAQLPPKGSTAFALYLDGSDEKAFAISGTGEYGYSTMQRFKSEAIRKSLEACDRASLSPCKLMMLNSLKVVE